jgi:hypothetical protein
MEVVIIGYDGSVELAGHCELIFSRIRLLGTDLLTKPFAHHSLRFGDLSGRHLGS